MVLIGICTVSPELSLFAHMPNESRQRVRPKIKHLAQLTVWLRIRVWRMSLRRTKTTIISWHDTIMSISLGETGAGRLFVCPYIMVLHFSAFCLAAVGELWSLIVAHHRYILTGVLLYCQSTLLAKIGLISYQRSHKSINIRYCNNLQWFWCFFSCFRDPLCMNPVLFTVESKVACSIRNIIK